MAAATIGYHSKRVVLYNVNGFWDGLCSVLDNFNAAGFIRGDFERFMVVANSVEELEQLIKEAIDE